jgi:hypothetical protein
MTFYPSALYPSSRLVESRIELEVPSASPTATLRRRPLSSPSDARLRAVSLNYGFDFKKVQGLICRETDGQLILATHKPDPTTGK